MKLPNFLRLPDTSTRPEKVSREAYEWFGMLYSGDITEAEFERYLDWAEQNPEQNSQLRQLEELWKNIPEQAPEITMGSKIPSAKGKPFSLLIPGRVSAACYALLLVSLMGILAFNLTDRIETFFQQDVTFQTARAETTSVNLPDGSVANLNVLSRIIIHYTPTERQVRLLEGEASFSVVHDSERPFIVSAGSNAVLALGTEFNTRIQDGNSLIVTLIEGRIQLTHNNQEQEETAVLDQPGLQALMRTPSQNAETGDAATISISSADLTYVLSWREGKLIFNGESLEAAIELINRHSTHNIRLQAPELSDSPVFGVFNSGDWEGFLSAVELSYPLKHFDAGTNLTILSAR